MGSRMNHWVYPSAPAFFLFLAILGSLIANQIGDEDKKTVAAFGLALLTFWTALTWHTILDSRTDVQFHRRTLRFEPGLGFAQVNLAYALMHDGRWDEAKPLLSHYVADHPQDLQARLALRKLENGKLRR
jgi:hypothetical protein